MPRRPLARPLGELVSVLARITRNVEASEQAEELTVKRSHAVRSSLSEAIRVLEEQRLEAKPNGKRQAARR